MEAPGPGPCGGGGSGSGSMAAVAEAQRENLSAAFSRQLNVNAKPFVPNVHAAEFVPSFLRGPAQPPLSPAGAAGGDHGAGSGAGGPSGKLPGWISPRHGRRPGAGVPRWAGWRGREAGRPARGALTAAPAGLGGAPPVWELLGLGRLGQEEQRPGDPGAIAPPRKAARGSPLGIGTVWDPASPGPVSATRPRSGD